MSEVELNCGHDMKVLVVDDNEVNAMVVSSMLELYDMKVTEVYSGKDAIDKAKNDDYDIIFMDYLMPEMNGIEATEEIRKLAKVKRPLIVVLSADSTQELKKKFEKSGVDDVIAKPLEAEKLNDILTKWGKIEQISQHENATNEEIDVVSLFSHVVGLDVEKGLSHMANSADNYIKVIEVAIQNIEEQRRQLQLYRLSQVQPSSMKLSFHSLKGIFLNLGAHHLSEQSQNLELACVNLDLELLGERLEQYLSLLDDMIDGLKKGMSKYDHNYSFGEEKYEPLPQEEYDYIFQVVVEGLKRYEYNELREGLKKLINASQGEQRERWMEVAKLVQVFKYEEALKLIDVKE
ncbi:MAG: response regulator [Lachnospiraceae bacterium]|nr:response regulator [Lachnospiraceae bacterium]